MRKIFDFNGIQMAREGISKTWDEFRECLAKGSFTYQEIEKAKEQPFLKAYDDLFHQHLGIDIKTVTIKDLKNQIIGRGTKLNENEVPDYERFIPKKEFITEDNRFSPPGIEWLYLAIGEDYDIHECAKAECKVDKGDRFGFCHFQFDSKYDNHKLINLTIADNVCYEALNRTLEAEIQSLVKRSIKNIKTLDCISSINSNENDFQEMFIRWMVYTYAKLLSEQIFVPLDVKDNRSITYAPFQTMAQYYISLGYSGIVYGSTVCPIGKNVVLFNKEMALPVGTIEDYEI